MAKKEILSKCCYNLFYLYFSVCRGALELGVIFDVSRSIPSRDFGPVKHALTAFLSQFTIGPKALRVGLIPFENEIHPTVRSFLNSNARRTLIKLRHN